MASGMKSRYAKQPKRRKARKSLVYAGLSRLGTAVARNPITFGGSTAFLVSLAFVSVNALWNQPQVHPSAFVSTRGPVMPVRAVPTPTPAPVPAAAPAEVRSEVPPRVDRAMPEEMPVENDSTGSITPPTGDNDIRSVQQVLNGLGLYQGPVDGLTGPQTRSAVENYRRIVGLSPGSDIDDALLVQLGLHKAPASSVQTAVTQPPKEPAQNAASNSGDVVKRVQAGLRAFGHDGIQVDGVMGKNTQDAIREFQSLFGLKVTGEADQGLLAKMQEIGLAE